MLELGIHSTPRHSKAGALQMLAAACTCLLAVSLNGTGTAQENELDLGRSGFSPWSVCYSPCGEKLAISGSGCRIWDIRKKAPKAVSPDVKAFVCDASYSPNGDYFATLSVNRREGATGNSPDDFLPAVVSLFDGKSSKLIRQLTGHGSSNRLEIMSLVWLPDGKRLASGANKTFLWDVESGRKIADAAEIIGPLSVTCGGKSILGLGRNRVSVVRWEIETNKVIGLFPGKTEIFRLTASPDGKWVAFADGGSVSVRSLDGRIQYELPQRAMAITFSHDSEILAVGGHETTVDLWSMTRKQFVKRIPVPAYSPTTTSLAFSPDDAQLAHARGTFLSSHAYAFDGYVRLLDAWLPCETGPPRGANKFRRRQRRCRRRTTGGQHDQCREADQERAEAVSEHR